MNTFDGLKIENINHCSTEDYSAGISAVAYYAPASFFKEINLPILSSDYESSVTVSINDIVFKNNYRWSYIDILINEGELKQNLIGPTKNKKSKSYLEFFIPGAKAKVLGFIQKLKNEDLIFLISILDGTSILFGNLQNYANFSSADFTSGKEYEDNSGVSASLISNSPIYFISEKFIPPSEDSNDGYGFIDLTQDY